MNNDSIQLIAAAVITLCQVYMMQPWQFPVFALIWDSLAKICYYIARTFDTISINARLNYFEVIHSGN